MVRRIIVFIVIISLVYIGFHYLYQEETDNFVNNIIDLPNRIFYKDKNKNSDLSLIITGTTLHISTGTINDLGEDLIIKNTGDIVDSDVINSGENDLMQEDILGNLLLDDIENLKNIGYTGDTISGFVSGVVIDNDKIDDYTGDIETGDIETGDIETGDINIEVEIFKQNEDEKVYTVTKKIYQTNQDIIDTKNLIKTIIK